MQIIFFGSFRHYSVIALKKLLATKTYNLVTIITTPPRPAGRHLKVKPTEVQQFAQKNGLPVSTPENLSTTSPQSLITNHSVPDFLVVAGYAQLLPPAWLNFPKIMAVNMHPSLLPNYRGPNPAEWAILNGETETGVTLIKMSPEFDTGDILAQRHLPIADSDTRETLYEKLYSLGGDLLVESLPAIASGQITPRPQTPNPDQRTTSYFYARRITRQDGFVNWDEFSHFLHNWPDKDVQAFESEHRRRTPASARHPRSAVSNAERPSQQTKYEEITRKFRAFADWPGIWSTDPKDIRVKLVSLNPLLIQYEGKKPLEGKLI